MTAPEQLGWCIVEQVGHRRFAGHLSEVELAGTGFLRLDVPETPTGPARTMLLAPSSIFALHPCGEPDARAVAQVSSAAPVQRWELPELAEAKQPAVTVTGPDWSRNEGEPVF